MIKAKPCFDLWTDWEDVIVVWPDGNDECICFTADDPNVIDPDNGPYEDIWLEDFSPTGFRNWLTERAKGMGWGDHSIHIYEPYVNLTEV